MYRPYFHPSAYRLTEQQVREFLNELGSGKYACKCDHSNAKKVMTNMRISEEDQDEFLEICKFYGGYCDCEIFWNAVDYIESDFQTIFLEEEDFEDDDLNDEE